MCGKGVQKRLVTCYEKNENDTIVKLEDDECSAVEGLTKPEEEKECMAEKVCETYDWITTPWVGCSDEEEDNASPAACGLGIVISNKMLLVYITTLLNVYVIHKIE